MEIGSIQKNALHKLKVELKNYKDYDFIDIRTYYQDDEDKWKPTKKGITIAPEKVGELIELIQKAKKQFKKES